MTPLAAVPEVAIVDTRCANLSSVIFAFERLGVTPLVTADPQALRRAGRVLLPGVGTASAAMRELERLGVVETLRSLTQPVLGICLGMQLLTRQSEEASAAPRRCLGMIDTDTRRLAAGDLPLPHMGWNRLEVVRGSPLLEGLDGAYMYFVHSYAVAPGHYTAAQTEYGQQFSSVVSQGNFLGAQFHPERSGAAGARLLENFLKMEAGHADSRP